jgi:hypothetical protein
MSDIILSAVMHAAIVGVLACLVSESRIATPIRERLGWAVLYCPVCLGFWFALPTLVCGITYYFTTIAISNVWMLVILKVYKELDDASAE